MNSPNEGDSSRSEPKCYKNAPYFVLSFKKTYTEEVSIIPNFDIDDHSRDKYEADTNFNFTAFKTTSKMQRPSEETPVKRNGLVSLMDRVSNNNLPDLTDKTLKKLSLLIDTTDKPLYDFSLDFDTIPFNLNTNASTYAEQRSSPLAITWPGNTDSMAVSEGVVPNIGCFEFSKPPQSFDFVDDMSYQMGPGTQASSSLREFDMNNIKTSCTRPEDLIRKPVSKPTDFYLTDNDIRISNNNPIQHRSNLEIKCIQESLLRNKPNIHAEASCEDQAVPECWNVASSDLTTEVLPMSSDKHDDFLDHTFTNQRLSMNSLPRCTTHILNDHAISNEYKKLANDNFNTQLNIRCDHNAASWFNEMPESNPFMTSNTVNDEGSYVPVLDNVTTQRINDKWHCPFDLPLHDLLNDDIVDDVCSKSFPTEATSSEAISHPNESCDTEKFSQNSNTLSHIPITDILSTQAFSPELNVKPLATKVCDETTVGKNNDYEYEYASTFLGDSTATVSKEPNVNRNVIMNYSRDSDIDGDDQHLKSRSTVITGEDVFLCPSYQLNLPYFIPISLSNALEPCEVLDKANNSDVILASHTPPNLVQEVQVPRSECVETESQLTTVFRRGHNVASDQGEIILDEAINDSQSAIQGISNQYIPYISQTNVKPNEKIAPVRDKGSNGDRSVPDILETYCKSDSDLPFNDQNPNEEFYSNTNCIKTVESSSKHQQHSRPIRVGLSKKHKVNPLHSYYINKKPSKCLWKTSMS